MRERSTSNAEREALQARIASGLDAALSSVGGNSCPPRLHAAMQYAVFPGGGRLRPQLCLLVASACGDHEPKLADGAAVALELLHPASLVHDDMPTFDDAATRRGRPSVHARFGEQLATLAGDALIVLAFDTLARAGARSELLGPVLVAVAAGVGAAGGIVAGQAWESEADPDLQAYHRAKTAALFEAAVRAGALAGGGDPSDWRGLGERIGEAYQIADDIADTQPPGGELGKPVGQDEHHARPSAVSRWGLGETVKRFEAARRSAMAAIPPCAGRHELGLWLAAACERLLPPAR